MKNRCDLPLYKGVLPKVRVTDITSNQMRKLANMDPNKKQFFMNERLYADDSEKDLMEGMAYIFGRRIEAKTNLGINMESFTNESYQKALKAAQEGGYNSPDALALGEEILKGVTKGAPLTNEQRALALPAFLKRFESQPLLNKQFLQAYESGDEDMTARFGAEIAKSIAMFAGVRADQNALSVGFNTYKYMYKQIQANAKITKLFQNGAC
jgi:hypothetical protein